jgi:hypothetical protein
LRARTYNEYGDTRAMLLIDSDSDGSSTNVDNVRSEFIARGSKLAHLVL